MLEHLLEEMGVLHTKLSSMCSDPAEHLHMAIEQVKKANQLMQELQWLGTTTCIPSLQFNWPDDYWPKNCSS